MAPGQTEAFHIPRQSDLSRNVNNAVSAKNNLHLQLLSVFAKYLHSESSVIIEPRNGKLLTCSTTNVYVTYHSFTCHHLCFITVYLQSNFVACLFQPSHQLLQFLHSAWQQLYHQHISGLTTSVLQLQSLRWNHPVLFLLPSLLWC